MLKQQVTNIARDFRDGRVAPSDACRGYALYAANTLINRSGPLLPSIHHAACCHLLKSEWLVILFHEAEEGRTRIEQVDCQQPLKCIMSAVSQKAKANITS